MYHDRVPVWNQKDRTLRVMKGQQVHCVYRQNLAKGEPLFATLSFLIHNLLVPSQEKIYQAILAEQDSNNQNGQPAPNTSIAAFLNEGLGIWSLQ